MPRKQNIFKLSRNLIMNLKLRIHNIPSHLFTEGLDLYHMMWCILIHQHFST